MRSQLAEEDKPGDAEPGVTRVTANAGAARGNGNSPASALRKLALKRIANGTEIARARSCVLRQSSESVALQDYDPAFIEMHDLLALPQTQTPIDTLSCAADHAREFCLR